jgi:hypothetical protein
METYKHRGINMNNLVKTYICSQEECETMRCTNKRHGAWFIFEAVFLPFLAIIIMVVKYAHLKSK